jgi:hypothetical protein
MCCVINQTLPKTKHNLLKKIKYNKFLIKTLIKTSNFNLKTFKSFNCFYNFLNFNPFVNFSQNSFYNTTHLNLRNHDYKISKNKTSLLKLELTPQNLQKKATFKVFNTYLEYSQKWFSFFLKPHFSYKLFLSITKTNDLLYLDIVKVFNRWLNTYTLLGNLFYYNTQILSFGNRLLVDETLSLNMKTAPSTLTPYNPFSKSFFFRNAKFGDQFSIIYKRIQSLKIENAFIFDVTSHPRTLIYLNSINIFTIGLVPITQNPWSLNYPIPVSNQSIITQYYFIKLFLYSYFTVKNQYFNTLKKTWNSLYF